jgi:hypothetical protein
VSKPAHVENHQQISDGVLFTVVMPPGNVIYVRQRIPTGVLTALTFKGDLMESVPPAARAAVIAYIRGVG